MTDDRRSPFSRPPSVTTARSLDVGLWDRQLRGYPETRTRLVYLGIVVATTVALYSQIRVGGAASARLLRDLHMSFGYLTAMVAIASALAALAAIVAGGAADRWGRGNLAVYGLGAAGLLTLLVFPLCTTKLEFAACACALGVLEGASLVATVALVRDFSPQLDRASAMGFWSLGPVLGSLAVTIVARHSLDHFGTWQSQYVIWGLVSMAIFLVALLFLRELSPDLRNQRMMDLHDRQLVELRARQGRVADEQQLGFRGVLSARLVGSAIAIWTFSILFTTLAAFTVLFFALSFDFSESRSNGLASWYWASSALALVLAGRLSDRLAVRKPFMLLGSLGSVLMTLALLSKMTHPQTSYATLRTILILLAAFGSTAYVAWIAAYSETIENRHPSLVARGLAVSGAIGAVIGCALYVLVPHVVHGVSTVANAPTTAELKIEGERLSAQRTSLEHEKVTLAARGVALTTAAATLRRQAAQARSIASTPSASTKAKMAKIHRDQAAFVRQATSLRRRAATLRANGTAFQANIAKLRTAAADVPRGWKRWLWICVIGQLLFIPMLFALPGRWSPSRAKRDIRVRKRAAEQELASLKAKL